MSVHYAQRIHQNKWKIEPCSRPAFGLWPGQENKEKYKICKNKGNQSLNDRPEHIVDVRQLRVQSVLSVVMPQSVLYAAESSSWHHAGRSLGSVLRSFTVSSNRWLPFRSAAVSSLSSPFPRFIFSSSSLFASMRRIFSMVALRRASISSCFLAAASSNAWIRASSARRAASARAFRCSSSLRLRSISVRRSASMRASSARRSSSSRTRLASSSAARRV